MTAEFKGDSSAAHIDWRHGSVTETPVPPVPPPLPAKAKKPLPKAKS